MIMIQSTLAAALVLGLPLSVAAEEAPTYERDIRPILTRHCTICHSAKNLAKSDVSGGLALDSHQAVLRGTQKHPVVAAGHASESELLRRLATTDDELRMPLGDDPLPPSEQDLIRRWIDAGLPRGEVPADAGPPSSTPSFPRKVSRSLDVVLATTLKVPKTDGWGTAGGPVELVLKVGPLPAVTALAFRGDGRLLAVGTVGQVVLWDLGAARPVQRIADLPGPVHALAFSRDGRLLAIGSGLPARSGLVRVYRVPEGTLLHDFQGHEDVVYGVAFRPDDARLASSSFDQTVRLWDLVSGQPAGLFKGHSDFVYDVAFARDGATVLSVSKDRTIKRFDAASLKGLRTYSKANEDVTAVAARPDGAGFVSAGLEPQLQWWTFEDESPSKRISGHSGPVFSLAFSGNGKRLISASGDKSVRLWDGVNGTPIRTLSGPTEWQYAAVLSDDAKVAAAGGWDGLVRIWDAETGTLRATLIQPPPFTADGTDWMILTPAGFFDASPDLRALLRYRVGGQEVPAEAPRSTLLQPEQVARALHGEIVTPALGK